MGTDTYTGVNSAAGSNFDDTIAGDANNNTLLGQAGNDTLEGRGGNDTLFGGAGADTLDGGSNTDTADYSNAAAGVTADLGVPSNNLGDAAGDSYISIENLRGSNFDDTISGDGGINTLFGQLGNDTLEGHDGGDTITTGGGDDTVVYSEGDDGPDTITDFVAGAGTPDTIDLSGFAGMSNLATVLALAFQSGSHTVIDFGNGNSITLQNVNLNNLHEDDFIFAAANLVVGTPAPDALVGTTGVDIIQGLEANDTLQGLAGDDELDGGDGRDTAVYMDATDGVTIDLAAGTASGDGVGSDTLIGIEAAQGSDFADIFDASAFLGLTGIPGSPAGVSEFEGMGGDDTIFGVVTAGGPFLRLSFVSATSGVTADMATGIATGDSSIGTDTFTGVGTLRGSAFDDEFYGSNNGAFTREVFEGRGGDDFFDGRGGFDTASYNLDAVTTGVTINLAAGTVTGDAAVGTDTLVSIEAARGTTSSIRMTQPASGRRA